mmetsp:Transcript_73502/g.202899  ORF Transcript_73502/g.202899 Transcript_73502/m.202899 type:complete len:224 (-) Transcript_73502:1461-2132(-)
MCGVTRSRGCTSQGASPSRSKTRTAPFYNGSRISLRPTTSSARRSGTRSPPRWRSSPASGEKASWCRTRPRPRSCACAPTPGSATRLQLPSSRMQSWSRPCRADGPAGTGYAGWRPTFARPATPSATTMTIAWLVSRSSACSGLKLVEAPLGAASVPWSTRGRWAPSLQSIGCSALSLTGRWASCTVSTKTGMSWNPQTCRRFWRTWPRTSSTCATPRGRPTF